MGDLRLLHSQNCTLNGQIRQVGGMAKPNRIKELEVQHGDLTQVIPRAVNQAGSVKEAAKRLGVSDSTLSVWLKKNGYRLITICMKEMQVDQ
jgi:DNA invertase Pin-like site-specific DNA recombinase